MKSLDIALKTIDTNISCNIPRAFDYIGLNDNLEKIYRTYDEFFTEKFIAFAEIHNIKNYLFFIESNDSCNASATRTKDDLNIIKITNGYPILMNHWFEKEFFKNWIATCLVNNQEISDSYCELYESTDFEIDKFALECSMHFTFHHEFRHICQFNVSKTKKNLTLCENLDKTLFNINRHALEFDADRIATFEVLKYIFSIKRKFHFKTKNSLKCLFYIGLSSIIITKNLFYFRMAHSIDNSTPPRAEIFYTEKYSHPHPLVRLMNIIEYFISNIRNDFPAEKWDTQEFITNTLGINSLYFKSINKKSTIMQDFFSELDKYDAEINAYNNQLYDAAIYQKAIRFLLNRSGIKYDGKSKT